MYSFRKQRSRGHEGERILDALFGKFFEIRRASAAQQRQGIDRVMMGKAHKQTLHVEYKTDYTAVTSGNAFIELHCAGSPGWALTSQAQYIAYLVPDQHVYVVNVAKLRTQLTEWERRFEQRTITNRGYMATGLLVPLTCLAEISETVYAV